MQNGILSIIQVINKPNCWQEALILYLASENELSKPNPFRCLEIHRFLPLNWCKTDLWLAQKNTWFSKPKVILFFENLSTTMGTQMMMFWRRCNDLFTRCQNFFSLIYIQFHHRWPKRNMGHLWHNMRVCMGKNRVWNLDEINEVKAIKVIN